MKISTWMNFQKQNDPGCIIPKTSFEERMKCFHRLKQTLCLNRGQWETWDLFERHKAWKQSTFISLQLLSVCYGEHSAYICLLNTPILPRASFLVILTLDKISQTSQPRAEIICPRSTYSRIQTKCIKNSVFFSVSTPRPI